MKFYISFGQSHVHRVNGKTFDADSLCEIDALHEDKAREMAFQTFGREWANVYDTLDGHLDFFPRGPIPLNNE